MVNYKRYTTISNSALSELIAVSALADHEANARRYAGLLKRGREALERFAAATTGRLSLVTPQGTPFAWFHLDSEESSRVSSLELSEQLLAEQRVLVMPAEVFGAERGFRLTYARPADVLTEGLTRLERLLTSLVGPR